MRKVMTTVLGVVAAMMVFSMAACTPTSEKNKTEAAAAAKTEAVKETKAEAAKTKGKASLATEKLPDSNAPKLEVVSIYTVSGDGTKLEGTMDAVEELNELTLADLLIQYGVLEEGTTVNSFSVDSEAESQEVGPGVTGPGAAEQSAAKGHAVLDLNKFPDVKDSMRLQAVANTFIENLDVVYVTISVEGEIAAENLTAE